MTHVTDSLTKLHNWLLEHDYDLLLPEGIEDPLDAVAHIQALEAQLQDYERAMQRAMNIYGGDHCPLEELEEESRHMYAALSEVYRDKYC